MIPSFSLQQQLHEHRDEYLKSLERVFDSGNFILGEEVASFEREIATYLGVKHAVGVANGSDALTLSLLALGIGPGDEVITTPFTFFATAGSVLRTGAKPIFVDVERGSMNINPELAEDAITKRTKAIIAVHLFGVPARMDRLIATGRRYRIPIIEDAAQAIGARWKQEAVGTVGDLGTFSFFPTKTLGAIGDAGMVVTSSDDLAETLRMLRVHGSRKKYYHEILGFNSRLDELQAAFLRAKLPHLPSWISRRTNIVGRYRERLSAVGDIHFQEVPEGGAPAWHQFTLRTRQRDALSEFLSQNRIGSSVYYPLPLHKQKVFEESRSSCPIAEDLAKEVLSLPLFPEMTEEEVDFVIEAVEKFYRRT